jgi:hypothetical protein
MKNIQLSPVRFRAAVPSTGTAQARHLLKTSFLSLTHTLRLLAGVVLSSFLISAANAHFVEGRVYCTASTGCPAIPTSPLAGVLVMAVGAQGNTASATTAADGTYHIELPEITQSYTLTIQVQPPLVPVCPANGQLTFFLDVNVNQGQVTGQNFYVNCTPPSCKGTIGDFVWEDLNGNGCQDAGEPGIPGVQVELYSGCGPGATLLNSDTTDVMGNYLFTDLCAGFYTVVFRTPTGFVHTLANQSCNVGGLPPDQTDSDCACTGAADCGVCVALLTDDAVDLSIDCGYVRQPNPCPDCSDPDLGLGAAAGCTVLQLGPAKVSITGPAGGIVGDICIAPNGTLSMSGDQFVTGEVHLGPGAKFSNSSGTSVNVVQNVDLSAEISAAYADAAAAASLPCSQSFAKVDGSTVTTIVGGVGLNVICVGDVVLGGKQVTLTGPAGAKFILNVSGKFVLTGGGAGPQIRVAGGVQPKDVLYNIIGTGADVAFSGGGGGVDCCKAVVDGTLLAPFRKINLSPGLVNGQVISGKDISIVSGSSVRCPCP